MPLDPSVHRARTDAACARLDERREDALVLYAQGSTLGPATRSHGYMRYLCDWDSRQNASILILRPRRPPVLLVSNIFATFYTRDHLWIEDVRFVKAPELCAAAARVLLADAPAPRRLALVGRNELPVPGWEALTQLLPHCEWSDFSPELDRDRMLKSDAQMAIHQQAADICDAMFETLRRELRTPRPAFQLQAEMERTARYAGVDYCNTWLTVGPAADYSHFYRDECRRVPQPGDQVLAGIYLIFDGHWGHAVRTGSMGPACAAHQQVFAVAKEMADAMLDALQPGGDLNAVQRAAEHSLARHYAAPELERIFRFRHGHALGHSYEDPISSMAFPQIYDGTPATAPCVQARPGMLFEIHPNLFVPGVGGACIGDMAAVTPQGHHLLTRFPRHLLDWLA